VSAKCNCSHSLDNKTKPTYTGRLQEKVMKFKEVISLIVLNNVCCS
jgi:hypothetical protein